MNKNLQKDRGLRFITGKNQKVELQTPDVPVIAASDEIVSQVELTLEQRVEILEAQMQQIMNREEVTGDGGTGLGNGVRGDRGDKAPGGNIL